MSVSHVQGGGSIKPENVYTAVINNFTYMQLWFGGGALQTFAVYKDGSVKLVDQVNIDLKRYGKPKIDQHKIVVQQTAKSAPSMMESKEKHGIAAKSDTTAASRRLETARPPGKKVHAVPAKKTRRPAAKRTPPPSSPSQNMGSMPGMTH